MDKQIITFSANEQNLVRIGGEYHYSSNKVSYIGAHFDLGANWDGFDSVRAVWFTDRINGISTVLDGEGNCTVPTEVLKKKDRVFVNLVGSIVSNGELTDRLTTYPAVALVVDSKAKVDSTETAPVTPSQFEQFVSIVQDAVANIKDIVSTTLNADYTLTFVYSDGTSYTTPSIRGERGPQGADGADGTDGNGIASAVLNSNYTLTLTFTDGTSYTTPNIRGAQGPKGDPGDVSQAQLDAAVSDLKEDISEFRNLLTNSKEIAYDTLNNIGIYQLSSFLALSGYKTARIPVVKGKSYLIDLDSDGDKSMGFCNYLGQSGELIYDGQTISNGMHFILYNKNYDFMYINYVTDSDTSATLTVYESEFNAEQRTDLSKYVTWTDGYGLTADTSSANYGKLVPVTGLKCSNYIPIKGMEKIEISIASASAATSVGLVFFDDMKNPINNKRNQWRLQRNAPTILDVPTNAYYVVTTIRSDTETYGDFVFNEISTNNDLTAYLYNQSITRLGRDKHGYRQIIVAPSDATDEYKAIAHYVCDGVNDEVELKQAIAEISYGGGTIVLGNGTFNIDSFGTYNGKRIAIPLTTITDSTWLKEIRGGGRRPIDYSRTRIVITATALSGLGNDVGYVFSTPDFTYGRTGIFKDFQVYLNDNQHKVTVIDNSQLSAGNCENLDISAVPQAVSNTSNTPMPVEECVGITGYCGDDSGSLNLMSNCFVTGFYEGYRLGGEHLVCTQLNARYNYYSYTFGNYDWHVGTQSHPITLINCCDEHSAKLPKFVRNGNYNANNHKAMQQIDLIGFNMELFVPENFGGGLVAPSEETLADAFCGRIEFTAYGVSNVDSELTENPITTNQKHVKFWADGSGRNFKTYNMVHKQGGTTAERQNYTPTYMQQFYDTTLGKMLVYDGSAWVDMNGNAAQ